MKSVIVIFFFFSHLSYSQTTDSLKKAAISFQSKAFKSEQNHDFEAAILFADTSINLDSTRYEAYIIKAESQWFLKRFSSAAETYKNAIRIKKPDFLIGAYVLLGMLYDKAGNRKEAKEQYLLAIKTWENGYTPPRFDKWEEIEYFIAFGLLRDKNKWKKKLLELQKNYPAMNKPNYEQMSRKELLEHHFNPYGG
jgi:tetratricopeptide (TPR) repeat protein